MSSSRSKLSASCSCLICLGVSDATQASPRATLTRALLAAVRASASVLKLRWIRLPSAYQDVR